MTTRSAAWLSRAAEAASVLLLVGAVWFCLPLMRSPRGWVAPAIAEWAAPPDTRTLSASSLESLSVIWQRDLRRPLVDPAPTSPQVAIEPAPSVQLVGTAIEGERRLAVFSAGGGRTAVRAAGEDVDGYEVLYVERGLARIRKGDRQIELRVPWYERLAADAHHGG